MKYWCFISQRGFDSSACGPNVPNSTTEGIEAHADLCAGGCQKRPEDQTQRLRRRSEYLIENLLGFLQADPVLCLKARLLSRSCPNRNIYEIYDVAFAAPGGRT